MRWGAGRGVRGVRHVRGLAAAGQGPSQAPELPSQAPSLRSARGREVLFDFEESTLEHTHPEPDGPGTLERGGWGGARAGWGRPAARELGREGASHQGPAPGRPLGKAGLQAVLREGREASGRPGHRKGLVRGPPYSPDRTLLPGLDSFSVGRAWRHLENSVAGRCR